MIGFEEVSKRFGEISALEGINLTVPEGQTTVLIGPSGCGKSTLLRLVIGLVRADSGTIAINGSPLAETNLLQMRRDMGYVIQEGGLFPHLTALKNVTLMARYLEWREERIEIRVRELAQLTHFPPDRLHVYPAELSGGQRQRVSLMRALMLNPSILLFDEPLAALDPMIRSDLQRDLRDIFKSLGKTVLLVTHDMGEASYFGDAIVLLREGQIVQFAPLDQLIHSPVNRFVTDFINAQRSPLESKLRQED
jgi:osmoprotectant transport system ATP-binding protein